MIKLQSWIRISKKPKYSVIALCLGGMVFINSHVSAQSIKSIPCMLSADGGGCVGAVCANQRDQQSVSQDTYFTYDIRGNILARVAGGRKTIYVYNAINQLIQIQKLDGSTINMADDYDVLGNMKNDPAGNQYQYNLLGQLTQFNDQDTGARANYRYYANGLRSMKAITMVEPIDYYYDYSEYSNIVNERQGQLTTSYLLSNGHMVRYVHDGQANIQKQIAVHGSKNVEVILNDEGKIQQIYHYSPNGKVRPIGPQGHIAQLVSRNPENFSITQNPFQYSGEYHDSEGALDYLRARYYNSKIQRFIQRDSYPLLNRYAYVNGNPIMGVDPSGHCIKALFIAMSSIIEAVDLVDGTLVSDEMSEERFDNDEQFGKLYDHKFNIVKAKTDEEYKARFERYQENGLIDKAELETLKQEQRHNIIVKVNENRKVIQDQFKYSFSAIVASQEALENIYPYLTDKRKNQYLKFWKERSFEEGAAIMKDWHESRRDNFFSGSFMLSDIGSCLEQAYTHMMYLRNMGIDARPFSLPDEYDHVAVGIYQENRLFYISDPWSGISFEPVRINHMPM